MFNLTTFPVHKTLTFRIRLIEKAFSAGDNEFHLLEKLNKKIMHSLALKQRLGVI